MGVSLGVDEPLSTPTRDFLEDERGVMLLFRNALTGVTFSGGAALGLGVLPLLVRATRGGCELPVVAAAGVAARRGVRGVFAVRLLASVGFSGRVVFGLERSMGILHDIAGYAWVVQRVRRSTMAMRRDNGAVAGRGVVLTAGVDGARGSGDGFCWPTTRREWV